MRDIYFIAFVAIILLITNGFGRSSINIVGTAEPNKITIRLRHESLSDIKVAVNGTFYSTKHGTLANLIIRDGKVLYPLPWWDTLERGCLFLFKDGRVYLGLVRTDGKDLFINKEKVDIKEVRIAIGGCAYFLRNGRIAAIKEMRKEGLSLYILQSTRFSFVAWNEKTGKIALGVSYGASLQEVGVYLKRLGYKEAIRLDGGSATGVWKRGRRLPNTNNFLCIQH